MVAGRGTPDQAPAKQLAANAAAGLPASDRLSGRCRRRLSRPPIGSRRRRRADISIPGPARYRRMISSAGACSRLNAWLLNCATLRPGAKVIGFPRGAGSNIPRYVDETGVDAVSLESEIDRTFAREQIQSRVPVQGNVDPQILLAGGEALDREVDTVLAGIRPAARISSISATASCRRLRSRMSIGCSSASANAGKHRHFLCFGFVCCFATSGGAGGVSTEMPNRRHSLPTFWNKRSNLICSGRVGK